MGNVQRWVLLCEGMLRMWDKFGGSVGSKSGGLIYCRDTTAIGLHGMVLKIVSAETFGL